MKILYQSPYPPLLSSVLFYSGALWRKEFSGLLSPYVEILLLDNNRGCSSGGTGDTKNPVRRMRRNLFSFSSLVAEMSAIDATGEKEDGDEDVDDES